MNEKIRIGFIGAGNMAQAIGFSIISKNIVSPDQIFVSAPSERNFKSWIDLGVNVTHDNHEVVLESDVVFLAVKPQYFEQVLQELQILPHERTFSKLIVSVMAGLSLETLHEKLRPLSIQYRLARIMPNTSLLVGEGFTAICPDVSSTEDDITTLKLMMSAGGLCELVPESLMGALGALSGSGVAFVYQIIEALSDGAVKQGVPRSMSLKIASQTLLGASKMVLTTEEHPSVLKDNVCSPGGTTICGIHALESGGLRATLMNAIEACVKRSEELDLRNKTYSKSAQKY